VRALLVTAHPAEDSLTAAMAARAEAGLRRAGHAPEVFDLERLGFDPAMPEAQWRAYHDPAANAAGLEPHAAALRTAEILVLCHPVWWAGPPARLKGWLDRTMLPGLAFVERPDGPPRPGLTGLRHFVVCAAYGAPFWLTRFGLGDPARRAMAGLRRFCAPQARFHHLALYGAELAPAARRERHLARIESALGRLG